MVVSPTLRAVSCSNSGVMTKPHWLMAAAAVSGVVPIKAAGLFMAKYTPGSMMEADTKAMTATKDSINMPAYPMKGACISFSSNLGVVPEEIREWKPDTAPQAMVMNRNGNKVPDQTGPVPSMNLVTAGILSSGATKKIPSAKHAMAPIFKNVDK